MHPHSLALSLSPGTRCCPLGWAGRQGSCNREWVGGGTETPPRCPLAGREGCKGPCWPQWVRTEVSAVYTQEGRRGRPLSQAAPGEGEGRSRWHCHASHAARVGPRMCAGARLLLGAADDGEDVQEDVDDVRVQVQRCEHVLLRAQRQLLVPQQQLGVHCQELGRQRAVLRGLPSLPTPSRPGRPPLTQVKSSAPSEAYTISRMRLRMKMQRMAKTISTTMLTRSTPMHDVKS